MLAGVKVSSLLLAVAVLACGCSQEGGSATSTGQEASVSETTSVQHGGVQPRGTHDLSHVKIGQRYTFALEQSDTKMHMVWVVTAVAAAKVTYTVSVLKNGSVLSPPAETSWAAVPAPPRHDHDDSSTPAKPTSEPGVTTSFETLTLAGRDWACRVTVSGDVKTWTALAGGAPTFPPLLKQTTGLVVSSVLVEIDG